MIAECGFEGVDANVDHLLTSKDVRAKMHAPAFDGDDKTAVEYFRPWKDAAAKYGISNFQAHAPFPSHLVGEDGAYNEYMMEVLRKTIIGAIRWIATDSSFIRSSRATRSWIRPRWSASAIWSAMPA